MAEVKIPFYKQIWFKISATLGFLSLVFALLSDSLNVLEKFSGKSNEPQRVKDTFILSIPTLHDTITHFVQKKLNPTRRILFENKYYGSVGKLDAYFTLNWFDNDEIEGYYTYNKRLGITYKLKGNNFTKGSMYLEEYTNENLTAIINLTKKSNEKIITWTGIMHNIDGREFEITLTKQ